MVSEPVFRDLVRHGRLPGPNNLLSPVEWFLKSRGSAKRNSIVRQLEEDWRLAGGQPLSGEPWGSTVERQKWESRVKRTLAKLRQQGRVREVLDPNGVPLHGTWEWVAPEQLPGPPPVASEAELNVGSGEHLVYGVYDSRDKQEATSTGAEHWLLKIGKTRGRSPYDRIQDGAFLPDRLTWGVAIWTDEPDGDERLIRGVLERRGRRYEGTGGKEWFVTSPDEVKTIYETLVGREVTA